MTSISLCSKSLSTDPIATQPIHLDETIYLRIADSIEEVEALWEALEPENNRFLQSNYLRPLERFPIKNGKPFYLVFFENKQPIGFAYCSFLKFRALEAVRADLLEEGNTWLQRLSAGIKKNLLRFFNFNLLVCGNLLNTGQPGFYFAAPAISPERAFDLVEQGLQMLRKHLQRQGFRVDGFFWKDFYGEAIRHGEALDERKYHRVVSWPNMILEIPDQWNSFQDYLGALTSKYRVRANRARKKAQGLRRQELSLEEVVLYKEKLHSLFSEVAQTADFNMAEVHGNYFPALKEALGKQFRVWGYFDAEGSLVGFNTNIVNGTELEAHFLGYPAEVNTQHQLYFNILLDIVRDAIEGGHQRVLFARTAMEIKSSVGARPKEIYCYVRHSNHLLNRLLFPFIGFLQPNLSWVERHPFKD